MPHQQDCGVFARTFDSATSSRPPGQADNLLAWHRRLTIRTKERGDAADRAFERHDFGGRSVTDMGGWNEDGPYWSRMVYGDCAPDEEIRTGDGRFHCSFGVEFAPDTVRIVDTWVG